MPLGKILLFTKGKAVPFRQRVWIPKEGRWLLRRCNGGRLWLTGEQQKLIDSHPLLLSKIWPKNSPTNQQKPDWRSAGHTHLMGFRSLWETWGTRVAWSLGFYWVCWWFHRGVSWLNGRRNTSEERQEGLGIVNHVFAVKGIFFWAGRGDVVFLWVAVLALRCFLLLKPLDLVYFSQFGLLGGLLAVALFDQLQLSQLSRV